MIASLAPFRVSHWCLLALLVCGAAANIPLAAAAGDGGKTEMSPEAWVAA